MRTSLWVCALASIAGSASAQSRTSPGVDASGDTLHLTRQQAIAMALTSNPTIAVAREQSAQVRAQRVEGMAIPDPTFTAAYDSMPRITGLSPSVAKPLNLSLTVPFPDKLRLQNRIGTANVNAADQNTRLVQQGIVSSTSQAYDALLVALMHRHDLTQADSLARDFLVKTQARFNAGTAARLDVIRAQVGVAQSGNALIGNARDIENAASALDRLIGRPLGAPLALADSLAVPPPLPGVDAVEQRALRSRPEILTVEQQQQAAQANATLIKEQVFLPDLVAGWSRDASVAAPSWYTVGISMPIPVFFWQHTRGDFAESQHRQLELAATLRDTRAAIGQDVRSSWATADAAERQARFIRDQLLPSAREAYRVAVASYAIGGLSALDVIDARGALLDAESQYADALAAANSARADLERAAGVPLSTFANGANRE